MHHPSVAEPHPSWRSATPARASSLSRAGRRRDAGAAEKDAGRAASAGPGAGVPAAPASG